MRLGGRIQSCTQFSSIACILLFVRFFHLACTGNFPVSRECVRAISDLLWVLSRIFLNLNCNLNWQSCRFTPFVFALITFSWQRHANPIHIAILNEYLPSGGKVAGFCAASLMLNYSCQPGSLLFFAYVTVHENLLQINFTLFSCLRKKSPKQM